MEDKALLPKLSKSLLKWAFRGLPLDCWTITLLLVVDVAVILLLLLGCGFDEIVPDEMWSIMERGRHVH